LGLKNFGLAWMSPHTALLRAAANNSLSTLLFFTLLDYPADLKFFNTIEKMSLNLHLRSERKIFLSV
jgi:hypothetical protein